MEYLLLIEEEGMGYKIHYPNAQGPEMTEEEVKKFLSERASEQEVEGTMQYLKRTGRFETLNFMIVKLVRGKKR